ncbi:tubulin-folding cofactor B-like [Saccoglossus kowalevskii]|uniref:Tubulin-folding cofactor B-like n=1 Tax=Saccoglossus kowalevskii TaxID=10224 RepID=A0ABM0H0Y0_SACKO|nr:PREDICTED: tubulin-folding cofactor B-like [Saccoglossus kowalevskii]
MAEFSVVTQSQVTVQITSSATSFASERRFPKSIRIGELKGKLELITGCSTAGMLLEVFDKNDKLIVKLSDDIAMLGSYPVDDGMRIHVHDPTQTVGAFEDVSKVEKFELSKEEYSKRSDSVLAFKKKMKMGQFAEVDEEEKARLEKEAQEKLENEKKLADQIKVGSRCEVNNPKNPPVKRGTVMYVGTTEFSSGLWVGVKYDEPLGKNDGSVKGKRYFECQMKYGGFVKPAHITVGDFPEDDLGFEDEM